jgi:2-octaprenyl-6-methoxyphenol hydroxylase
MSKTCDTLVIGGGLVGLTTALALAKTGLSVILVDRDDLDRQAPDGRASSLAPSSLRLFENLDVEIKRHVQPIRDMLVTEGAPDSPWRLHFEGDGDGADLGGIIENTHLRAALLKALKSTPEISVFSPAQADILTRDGSGVIADINGETVEAKLLVAADGRESVLRRRAGITSQRFDYDVAALVTILSHALPHDGLAWQGFSATGPMALLPLTGQRSQLVWSGPTAAIQAATQLPEADFLALLSERSGGYLGALSLGAPRASWPLRLQMADAFTAERFALVGDAAHVIHPLAGQGLNLGLRDAASLADGLSDARQTGQDIGVSGLLDYESSRRTDAKLLGATTHSLSKLFQVKRTAIGHARRLGLSLTNRSSIAKSGLQREAAGEIGTLPRLMRPGMAP